MATIENGIRNFIVETFLFGQGGEDLRSDASLLEMGVVDSTGVLEIVAFLEESFGVQVDDEELVPENFDSIARLRAFVQQKLSHAAE